MGKKQGSQRWYWQAEHEDYWSKAEYNRHAQGKAEIFLVNEENAVNIMIKKRWLVEISLVVTQEHVTADVVRVNR